MASVDPSTSINGFNGQPYAEQAYQTSEYSSSAPSHSQQPSQNTNQDIPKDEVGWYFVEQYYTTLSKNPEKLFLFYNKRSQYVSGSEAEKVMTCVGQKAIHDRITSLGIQDCKVRVTNVDSQGSGANIVIQVIGEISNRGEPQRKFVQTFVLAEQTNGYFVLNDIFRYILEDEDDGQDAQLGVEKLPVATSPEHTSLPANDDAAAIDQIASAIDTKLQEEVVSAADGPSQVPPVGSTNGVVASTTAETVVAEDAPVAAPVGDDPSSVKLEDASEQVVAEDVAHPDIPKEPESTPAQQSPPKQPSTPARPAAPTTWAGLVAGGRVALPSSASSSTAPIANVQKAKSTATVAPPASAIIPQAVASDVDQAVTPVSSGSEWQTAQRDGHARKQSRAQAPAATASTVDNSRGYIKNVSASVTDEALREKLNSIGKLVYFDVNRQKNCAFVDFADATAYQAAVAASPIEIAGERLFIEERRVKSGVNGNFAGRGGFNNRGRGGDRAPTHGRGGFQREGGRGGFNGRGGRGSSAGGGGGGGGGGARGRGGVTQTA